MSLPLLFLNALSETSLFPRQEIEDGKNDTISYMSNNYTKLGNNNLPDIESVSFSSDGENLNTTIWLSSSFEEKPSQLGLRYLMYIDVDTNNETGLLGADYAIGIRWDNRTGTETWYKEFLEFSEYNKQKIIRVEENFTKFTDIIGDSVHLSLPLKEINYPEQYNIAFSVEDISQGIYDTTSWIPIPFPKFQIATSPNSLVLRPGDEKIILFVINSTTNLQPEINLYTNNKNEDIILDINPNRSFIPTYGMTSSQLHVKISKTAKSITEIIPLFVDVHFHLERANDEGIVLKKNSYLSLTILPALTIPEYINTILNTWGSPVKEIITLLAAIGGIGGFSIITWVLNKIRKKRKEDKIT
jgi:hypothetical protein